VSVLLAFDTSGEWLHAGLAVQGRTWLHESPGGAKASAELLPVIQSLLARAGVQLSQVDAVGFGRGPGAFTGLRTACSVAQGLALGAGKPVLAIDTLLAVAEDARGGAETLQVWTAMDARMEQIYAAQYAYSDGGWSVLDAPRLASADELNRIWAATPAQHVAGNALAAFAGRLACACARRHADAAPRAAALLTIAQALWEQGAALDAAAAMPSYVRDKVAQTVAERAAQRSVDGRMAGPVG
jgi:tRNA threonylcarbamoyladenosine biosynthesis protein TsaB